MSVPGPKVTIIVQRVTRTKDGQGGEKEAWNTFKTLTGGFSVMSSYEVNVAAQKGVRADHKIFFEYDADTSAITEADRVSVGGLVFEITGIENPAAEGHHLEMQVRRFKP